MLKLLISLHQGSGLAPSFFNVYISDLPLTEALKFGYADDWTLLYFAHLLSPSYIRSNNIVCQCVEDLHMSSTLIRSLTSRCVPSQAL